MIKPKMEMAIPQLPLPPLSHGVRFNSFRTSRRNSHENSRLCSSPLRNLTITKSHNGEEDRKGEEDSSSSSSSSASSYSVMAEMRSLHNDIVGVDAPNSRVLLLDSIHNIHSMLNKEQKWTGSYWDEFASLPAIIPQGPIALLGLGVGTAAHLFLDLWPSLHIESWEIDEILIDMAREFFCLSVLEKSTPAGGSLSVHIGDALSPSIAVQEGFAGIIVDLFIDGKILPQLTELSWKRMAEKDSDNYLALTGPPPYLDAWSTLLPNPLSSNAKQWRPCELAS